jgi:hypothetical protein
MGRLGNSSHFRHFHSGLGAPHAACLMVLTLEVRALLGLADGLEVPLQLLSLLAPHLQQLQRGDRALLYVLRRL